MGCGAIYFTRAANIMNLGDPPCHGSDPTEALTHYYFE
jgi:hypothetical protein